MRTWFEDQSEAESVLEALGITDADGYWETVKTNLAAEHIRLVFVADDIPPELRSIVEFLNRQMTETEVFAIEVKQYVDSEGERQTIVPRVLGRTEAARAAKSGGARRKWDKESLLEAVGREHGHEVKEIAEALINWAESEDRPDIRVEYGTGSLLGTAKVKMNRGRITLSTAFYIRTDGTVQIIFVYLKAPFDESRKDRDELRRRINEAVPQANIPYDDGVEMRLRSPPSENSQTRDRFFTVIGWAFDKARQAESR